ncbi:MAG: transcriptional regulator [Sphingobacteriales bacterium]|nr:transcriptional regulator [Sphingobacteriales bacterium]
MRLLPALLVFLLTGAYTAAQNTIGLPRILNYKKNEFHAGSQTWDIRQDKYGRMYFANNEGLVTFDGSYWKTYPQPNKTILRSIAIENDRVYAGGQDEIGYYKPDNQGVLRYFSIKQLIPEPYTKFADIWDIEVYKGSVFFRSWEWIFEYKDDAIKVHPPVSGWQILKKTGDKLIAQDFQKGLYQFEGGVWKPLLASGFPHGVITGIVTSSSGDLLISTHRNGIFSFSNGSLQPWKTQADPLFLKHNIYSFERINADEYVAGTVSMGCIIINNHGQVVQYLGTPEGLQNNNILSVYIDNEKNLWTGLNNGISFIAYNAAIKYIKPGRLNEVTGYSTLLFNNRLYIATSDGAYSLPVNGPAPDLSFVKGDFSPVKNTSGQTWRVAEVNGRVLLGHHNGCYDITNSETRQLTTETGAWIFLPASPIQPSANVLMGTYAGLSILNFKGAGFTGGHPLKGDYISLRFLATDNKNIIWASHPYRGVFKIIPGPDSTSYSTTIYTQKDGLPSGFRNHVFRINNRVVVGTEKGVYEFNDASGKFVPSPSLYPIFGNRWIQYLAEDKEGNLWFCSDKMIGVAVLSDSAGQKKYTITYFPELTGKILSGFESIYPYSDENIFISSEEGIIHLNFSKYIANNKKITPLLTQVKLLGEKDSIVFGGYPVTYTGAGGNKKPAAGFLPLFSGKNNSFHFEYSATAFSLRENIEYSYRLEGYEHNWSAWSAKTEKDYTNLPSGSYTFHIRAHDNLGNESEPLHYSFRVLPPWYKSTLAYLIYTLLLASLVFALYKWQRRKFHQQEEQFAEEQRKLKYVHQLEMEQTEKEIIKLQNEKLTSEILSKQKKLADVSLHLAERGDALIKVKDELQKLYKKTGGDHDVKKALHLVNDIEESESNWEQFASHFDEINNNFLKKLKSRFPSLTNTDLKVCTYLQLKLSSKEIAQLLNISVRGVEISRYRLRKKLQVPTEQSINDYFNSLGD